MANTSPASRTSAAPKSTSMRDSKTALEEMCDTPMDDTTEDFYITEPTLRSPPKDNKRTNNKATTNAAKVVKKLPKKGFRNADTGADSLIPADPTRKIISKKGVASLVKMPTRKPHYRMEEEKEVEELKNWDEKRDGPKWTKGLKASQKNVVFD